MAKYSNLRLGKTGLMSLRRGKKEKNRKENLFPLMNEGKEIKTELEDQFSCGGERRPLWRRGEGRLIYVGYVKGVHNVYRVIMIPVLGRWRGYVT